MIPEDADAAPCGTCWKPTLLDHDPPCLDCGEVTCPDCLPHDCDACPACQGAGEHFHPDPTDQPYGYTTTPCGDCAGSGRHQEAQ